MIAPANGVQTINCVGPNMVLFAQMRSTVCKLCIPLDDLKGFVRLIAYEAGMERIIPRPSYSRGGDLGSSLIYAEALRRGSVAVGIGKM